MRYQFVKFSVEGRLGKVNCRGESFLMGVFTFFTVNQFYLMNSVHGMYFHVFVLKG